MDGIGTTPALVRGLSAVAPVVVWVGDDRPEGIVSVVLGERFRLRPVSMDDSIERHAAGAGVVVINATGSDVNPQRVSALLDQLDRTDLPGLLLVDDRTLAAGRFDRRPGALAVLTAGASPDLITGHVAAMAQLQPTLAELKADLAQARTSGAVSAQDLSQLEEEIRLAAKLQRDFMPRELPEVGPLRFGIMFRPAAWVSGDIYDVARLDERHVGFYIADAVGHGMPAALLTMFIKRALPTKRIGPDGYALVAPDAAMAELNEAICDQDLPSCQFCSAFYGLVNTDTLEMRYARGGHPEPLLLRADGRVSELEAPGGLLGVFPDEHYALRSIQLVPGERVVLYSDGAEGAFRRRDCSGREGFVAEVQACRHLPPDLMAMQLAGIIDDHRRDLPPEDDITILILDVAEKNDCTT